MNVPPQSSTKSLEKFLPHADQLGCFLNTTHFHNPPSTTSKAYAALIGCINLWSFRFSKSDTLAHDEPRFLTAILHDLSQALNAASRRDLLYAMQSESLVAQYFFSRGRHIEGQYHATAAMALALSCRLNKIGTSAPSRTSLPNWGVPCLPPGDDATGEAPCDGEFIRAFWSIFVLNKCWSVAAGSPCDDWPPTDQIDTPWPMEVEDDDLESAAAIGPGGRALLDFFTQKPPPTLHPGRTSTLALRVKASAILERAARVSGRHKHGTPKTDASLAETVSVWDTLREFIQDLPPPNPLRPLTPERRRSLLVTHSLAHAAVIKLHTPRAESESESVSESGAEAESESESESYSACLDAARAIAGIIHDLSAGDLGFLDPIIGVTWLAGSNVFIREIVRVQGVSGARRTASTPVDGGHVFHQLDKTIRAMDELRSVFTYIGCELDIVKGRRDALFGTRGLKASEATGVR